jgi:hypothetical protein
MAREIGLGAASPLERFMKPDRIHRDIAILTMMLRMIYRRCDTGNRVKEGAVDGGGSLVFGNRVAGEGEGGCAYILDGGGRCGGRRRDKSPYCDHHHGLCHVAEGSAKERRRLREAEALASAVGGRRGRPARVPPERFLRRLENVSRGFTRSVCSCIVHGDGQ